MEPNSQNNAVFLCACGWRQLRKLISDFSIFMSIMTFVGIDMLLGLKTPKLIVPTEFKVPLTSGVIPPPSTTGTM